jgi:hypothetical protein
LVNPGDLVSVKTVFGDELERVAVTGVVMGGDFPVVWVCPPEEWKAAQAHGRQPHALPWPADDVRVEADRALGT